MKDVKIDFSKLKHVKSDKDSTTLQHRDGHMITLAHKPLSKDTRAQLEAMAHGGKEPEAAKAATPRKQYAEGSESPISVNDQAPIDVSKIQFSPEMQAQQGIQAAMQNGIQIDANQVPVQDAVQTPVQPQLDPITGTMRVPLGHPEETPISIQDVAQKGMMGAILHPESQAQQALQTPDQSAPSLVTPTPAAAPSDLSNPAGDITAEPESMLRSGFGAKQAGLQAESSTKQSLAADIVKQRKEQIEAQELAKTTYKNSYDSLEKERQDLMQDVKDGHIDPEKYWTGDANGNGSHSKIAAGIGMIIAGFNPTNSPNAAINFLKHQMDINLQAQTKNLDSKQNLLAANLRQFGNLHDATQMTKIMQNDMMANQLELAAAKAATPMAKAQLLQASGQLKMESAPMFQQFAMRHAMMQMANSGEPQSEQALDHMIGTMRIVNPEMAKEMSTRRVPGFGLATVPVPEGIRKEITEKSSLNTAANDLLQYSKAHTNINPGSKEYNFGVAKAMAFQQKVREGLLGTVFRESEKPLLEKFVSENPAGAMKAFSTQPKLKAIIDSNMLGLHSTLQSYGLKTPQAMQPQAKPEIADGDIVTAANGLKYKRQGNHMVRVK